MLNIVETPTSFKVYFDTVQNTYVVRVPYERPSYQSNLQKDPVRYHKSENFQFDDEMIFHSFGYGNSAKGVWCVNRMGRKFHFQLKDFQRTMLSDKKFIDQNGSIVFPGRYTFKRHGSNNFCTML